METLADYGTVQYFGVGTFTTGIFRTFYGFDDLTAASQLSAALLLFIVLLIFLERYSRRRARYDTGSHARHEHRIRLSGGQAVWAWVSCVVPVVLGFVLPGAVLLKWAAVDAAWGGSSFLALVWNSFYLAALAALIAVACALVLGYARRNRNTRLVRASVGVSGLGYAIPGAIVAIGVIVPLAWVDHRLIDLAKSLTGAQIGLVLSGSIVALLFAYTVRFLAISLGAVQNGLDKIKPSLDYATRSLGRRPIQVLAEIHVPLMRSTVLTALLIVFVDVMEGAAGDAHPPAVRLQHARGARLRIGLRRAARGRGGALHHDRAGRRSSGDRPEPHDLARPRGAGIGRCWRSTH